MATTYLIFLQILSSFRKKVLRSLKVVQFCVSFKNVKACLWISVYVKI